MTENVLAFHASKVLGVAFASRSGFISSTFDLSSLSRNVSLQRELDALLTCGPERIVLVRLRRPAELPLAKHPAYEQIENWAEKNGIPVTVLMPWRALASLGVGRSTTHVNAFFAQQEISVGSQSEKWAVVTALAQVGGYFHPALAPHSNAHGGDLNALAVDIGRDVGFAIGRGGFQVSTAFESCDVEMLTEQLNRAGEALPFDRIAIHTKHRHRSNADEAHYLSMAATVVNWAIRNAVPYELIPRSNSSKAWLDKTPTQDAILLEANRRGFTTASRAEANALVLFDYVLKRGTSEARA